MSDKLELKHLAPYLPYGLKCQLMGMVEEETEFDDNPKAEVFLIEGANTERVEVWTLETITDTWHYEDVFPILRPLSDLTEVKDPNIFAFGAINDYFFDRVESGFISYGQMCFLLEKHFDVFGLIEKGLAIDKNTLDK